MSYLSISYLFIFLLGTFIAYNLTPLKKRWIVLMCASILFYLISSRQYIVYILLSALTVYFGAIKIDKYNDEYKARKKQLDRKERKAFKEVIDKKKKHIQALVVVFNVGVLAFLKYSNMFVRIINRVVTLMVPGFHLTGLKLVTPLGISFYTLQAIGYLIDVTRGKYKADHHFGRVFNFLIFFPTITEGPIATYDQVANQIHEGHPFNYQNFACGIQLMMWGIFKKLIVADRAYLFVHQVFRTATHYKGIVNLIAMALYVIELYCDFSGGMDIVVGSAETMGIFLPKNFDTPFFSRSVNEFWRKWHITLGAWLREYVFFSVTLSKPFKNIQQWFKKHFNAYFGRTIPVILALFCVWFLMGVWHGARIKYIVYGMYYYLIMVAGMLLKPVLDVIMDKFHIDAESKAWHAFQTVRTWFIVMIGMTIFNAGELYKVKEILVNLTKNFKIFDPFILSSKMKLNGYEWIVLLIGIAVVIIVDILHYKGWHLREEFNKRPIALRYAVYFVGFFTIFIFGAYGTGYNIVAFLYGAF